jgi:hypothetical protein
MVNAIMARRSYPEQGFRTYMGVLQLHKALGVPLRRKPVGLCARRGELITSVASISFHNLYFAVSANVTASTTADLRGPPYLNERTS